MNKEITEFLNGDVYMWIEQDSSIHMKASTKQHNDPVELTPSEAKSIAQGLIRLADEVEKRER